MLLQPQQLPLWEAASEVALSPQHLVHRNCACGSQERVACGSATEADISTCLRLFPGACSNSTHYVLERLETLLQQET